MNHQNNTFFTILFLTSLMAGMGMFFIGEIESFILATMIFAINTLVWKHLVHMLIVSNTTGTHSPVISLLFSGKIIILLCSVWWMISTFSILSVMTSYVVVLFSLLLSYGFKQNKVGFSHG